MDGVVNPNSKAHRIKISIFGKSNVGKTSLTYSFINYNSPKVHDSTIEDKYKTVIEIDSNICEIDILDTAGNDNYQNLLDSWISYADGFMLVFAINDRDSLMRLNNFRERILKVKHKDVNIILVGNKCDMENERVISEIECKEIAKLWGAKYIETSSEVRLIYIEW